MIKEKEKVKKKKTLSQVVGEYLRTIALSFLFALVVTTCLSIHARDEMIKNLYISAEEQQKIEEKIAIQVIAQANLTKDLNTKSYAVCMQVGNIYATAKDYKNAQVAYELAILRAKPGIYEPYKRLAEVLIEQEKFDEANALINSVHDVKNKQLIKFKTRAYIDMGDKYYSLGKFLKAAKNYEKAMYYYNRFTKKNKEIEESIRKRIVNSYSDAATILVQNGYNSDAASFLRKAELYAPDDFHIKYKLAIIYSDLDPIKSVEYFEPLLKKKPQYVDYNAYNKALIKAANISDLEGDSTKAKYYRYKSHSIDLKVNQKIIYKDDIEVIVESFAVNKFLFKYHLKGVYRFKNVSNYDIHKMYVDILLKDKDKTKETYTIQCVSGKHPLYSNGEETQSIEIKLGKNIYTKRELSQYTIEIYAYKDPKFKTLIATYAIPQQGIKKPKVEEDIDALLGN